MQDLGNRLGDLRTRSKSGGRLCAESSDIGVLHRRTPGLLVRVGPLGGNYDQDMVYQHLMESGF